MGTLYYGDNLDILARYIGDESVDLVYLDPPFNSAQTYNAFFQEKDGSAAASQIKAFEDTWHWNADSVAAYNAITEQPGKVSEVMQAFRTFLGSNDMMAYLAMMAPRLVELRRVLKPTGSLYLHCDPTASHYLKLLLDAVFGGDNFRNEIIWVRTGAKGLASKRLPSNHDVILAYQKTDAATWNDEAIYRQYDEDDLDEKTDEKYSQVDSDGRRYQLTSLLNPNTDRPNLKYEFLGITRVWRWTKARMQAAYAAGIVVQPSPGAVPRFKRYLDEQKGKPLSDVWNDIPPINSQAKERLGYPTQKPVALLQRIVAMSSNPGDLVLDPFCGCGTTIDAAQMLKREWIGIDITSLSTALIKSRLRETYGGELIMKTVGEPTSAADAAKLAADDKYQFQWWALGLVGARPIEQKKGADHGIDGKILFREAPKQAKPHQVILSVKGGATGVKDVRDLRGVIEREGAVIGVLITLNAPTGPMKTEAADAGFYESKVWQRKYPKLQIFTVAELLEGRQVARPPTVALDETFKRAPKASSRVNEQPDLDL